MAVRTTKAHTPGPWRYGESTGGQWFIYGQGSNPIPPGVCVTKGKLHDGEIEANVRLMAKAPEMLAVLEEISRLLGMADESSNVDDHNLVRIRRCYRMAEDVIRKVKGDVP
jgi:hypothetical protein